MSRRIRYQRAKDNRCGNSSFSVLETDGYNHIYCV